MKLSMLREIPSTRSMIDVFRGYNHNLRIGEGEFYDMKNLTSAGYPTPLLDLKEEYIVLPKILQDL